MPFIKCERYTNYIVVMFVEIPIRNSNFQLRTY